MSLSRDDVRVMGYDVIIYYWLLVIMKIETIVGNLTLIESLSMALSTESDEIIFRIEDVDIVFQIKKTDDDNRETAYNIKIDNRVITFECYLFNGKSSRFGTIKKPAKVAKINNSNIYMSFVFYKETHQPVYTLTINFFKENSPLSNSISLGEE